MLNTLLFMPDIKIRYRVKDDRVARRIMREMGARGRGKAFFVTEDMVTEWEISQTSSAPRKEKKPKTVLLPEERRIPRRA